MIRKSLMMAAMIVACICMAAAAQSTEPFLTGSLPRLDIWTTNRASVPAQSSSTCRNPDNGSCGSSGGGGFGLSGYNYRYVQIDSIKLTVPGDPSKNLTRKAVRDSIRGRGNSTGSMNPRPYRIKFNSKVGIFGREANKSWVLLPNYYDDTRVLNAVAFELGRRVGLKGTPTVQFVELYINGTKQNGGGSGGGWGQPTTQRNDAIYMLTDQVQVNKGRIDIDEDKGWFAEFDFHPPAQDECDSYFKATGGCFGVYIKSPEDKTKAQYAFVRDSINKITAAVHQGGTAWRDMIDFESVARYLLIQGFMANSDFYSSGGNGPGSNFVYQDACHKRLYAGPLWDLDLSVGYHHSGTCSGFGAMGCPKWNTFSLPFEPALAFWKTIWDDGAFQAKLKEIWTAHKSDFESMPNFVTQLGTHIGHTTNHSQLSSWLVGRTAHVNNEINRMQGNSGGYTQTPEAACKGNVGGDVTLTVNRTPENGGKVTLKVGTAQVQENPAPATFLSNTEVTITAVANEGWKFKEWTGTNLPTTITNNKTNATPPTWTNASTRTITAVFEEDSSGPKPTGDTIKVEAESRTLVNGSINTDNTGTPPRLNQMQNGSSATYTNINIPKTGRYTLEFMVASSSGQPQFNFSVTVNGQTGNVSGNTGNSSNYQMILLSTTVELNQGNNNIVVNFTGPLHFDYFLIYPASGTSVKHCFAVNQVRTTASLRADVKGISALLPANHGYTSYKLIDLQGREIASGTIGAGINNLRFNNVRTGVVFLKLNGKHGTTTLRTTAIR